MNRQRMMLAAVAVVGIFSAAALLATNFQIYEISAGNFAITQWPTSTITWNLNFLGTPANVTENGSGITASTVIGDSFSTWANATEPGTSTLATNVQFNFGAQNLSFPQAPTLDCQNVVGFADPNAGSDFPTGVIAFAEITTTPSGFVPGANCPSYTTPCPISNCIVDVDIMFNPSDTFATSSASTGQYDLESVAIHEIGHLAGLDHSNIAHAVMYPYGDTSNIGVHQALSTDDIVGIGHLFPGPGSADGNGIKGTVTLNSSGLYAADVEAIDATTGNVITETLTDPSGNYHLRLYDGTYYVYVQPLAPSSSFGPTTIANFRGQAGFGDNNFSSIPANPTNYTGKYY